MGGRRRSLGAGLIAHAAVALAARLVPRRRRAEWRREWEAELESQDATYRTTLRRAVAAIPDALAVRRLEKLGLRGGAEAGRRPPGGRRHRPGSVWWADLADAARTLRRSPGFTAAVATILALGIGANAAVFALVDGVLLRPLPYPGSERIVALWERHPGGTWERARITPATYFDVERQARSFEAISPIFNDGLNLTGEGEPLQVSAARVAADYFDVLGVHPFLGRGLEDADEGPGAEPVIVLAFGLWRDRFGADPGIVGRLIEADGEPVRVVGVMPPGAYPTYVPTSAEMPLVDRPDQAWLPLSISEELRRNRRSHVVGAVARVRPEVGLEAAREELTALAGATEETEGLVAVGLRDQVVAGARQGLWLLQGAVVLVVLLVLANVTGLLLVRGTSRERELAVRAALGAGRGRLARQLTLETVLLSLLGGGLGAGLAAFVLEAVRARALVDLPRLREVGLDARAAGFAALLAVGCGLVAGAALVARQLAALRRPDLRSRETVSRDRGARRLRRSLVVVQVALAVTLAFGAGLLLRSFWSLTGVDPGFRAAGLVHLSVSLPSSSYAEPGQVVRFHDAVGERMRGLPGVEGVSCAYDHPLDASWTDGFRIVGRAGDEGSGSAQLRIVCDGWTGVAGVPLRRGRDLRPTDRMGAPGAALVNEAFVRAWFRDREALGERLEVGTPSAIWGDASPATFEIVGVVGDVRFLGLDAPAEPAFYLPFRQFPIQQTTFLVRAAGDGAALVPALREAVWSVDPRQPVAQAEEMASLLRDSVARERFQMRLVSAFGAAGLFLVALSLYVLLAHGVARRRREIGLRMAIGAGPGDVRRQVIGHALGVASLGLALGSAGALALGHWLEGSLYGVSTADPWFPGILAGVLLVLGAVAGIASSLPARRATRIDPAVTLRDG